MPNFQIVWMKNEKMKYVALFAITMFFKTLNSVFSKSNFCSVLQLLQKNGGSDRFEIFFAFAEHVSLRAEPPY